MLYILILILVISLLLFLIIKDFQVYLKINGIVMVVSSLLIFIFGIVIRYLINNYIDVINLSKVSLFMLKRFMVISLILFLVGILEFTISKLIKSKKNTCN